MPTTKEQHVNAHTNGLLRVVSGPSIEAIGKSSSHFDTWIGTCDSRGSNDNDEANAARLVACWNACAGMDDPQVEIAQLKLYGSDFREIIALIAALKFCRSVLAKLPPSEMSERMAIEQADAALSRATGAQ